MGKCKHCRTANATYAGVLCQGCYEGFPYGEAALRQVVDALKRLDSDHAGHDVEVLDSPSSQDWHVPAGLEQLFEEIISGGHLPHPPPVPVQPVLPDRHIDVKSEASRLVQALKRK